MSKLNNLGDTCILIAAILTPFSAIEWFIWLMLIGRGSQLYMWLPLGTSFGAIIFGLIGGMSKEKD